MAALHDVGIVLQKQQEMVRSTTACLYRMYYAFLASSAKNKNNI